PCACGRRLTAAMTNEIESLTTDISARRTGSGVSPVWFAFAGLAFVLALYAHWRFGQFDERIDRLRAQTAEVRREQQRVEEQLVALTTRFEQSHAALLGQLHALREVPTQVGELGQTVAELRARTEAPQRAWVRAEALYLLELAARRLRLEHDVPTAIAAMESADARLATVSDPALAEVRVQLARELAALRAVDVPDLPAVIARLTALEAGAGEYRVLGVPVAKARGNRSQREQESGRLELAKNRLVQAWHDLFSFRRVDPATTRLVTQEEESLRRQHLELLIFASRVAAMQQDRAAYQQSLQAARQWLDRFFDAGDPAVAQAQAELVALFAIDLDPVQPEVGRAANLLQRLNRTGSPAPAP
ncbi:MAG: uroporphyrinogen-III C-methyltransferase, partial [Steroidobacteraceae bacterium]